MGESGGHFWAPADGESDEPVGSRHVKAWGHFRAPADGESDEPVGSRHVKAWGHFRAPADGRLWQADVDFRPGGAAA
jgi:hypothetical protein